MGNEDTSKRNPSQAKLPAGLFVGVIPPDGTILSLTIWLMILDLTDLDSEAFVKQLRKDKVPRVKFCGTMLIDSTHIRRIVHCGRGEQERGDD